MLCIPPTGGSEKMTSIDEAKKKAVEQFKLHGGNDNHVKWFKACLDELVDVAKRSVWEEAKCCPECGAETKISRTCDCG